MPAELLQSAVETVRQNAETVLAVAVGIALLVLVLAAFWLGAACRRRHLARLAEETRALEKSLAQTQADGAAAHRQLCLQETDLRRLAGQLDALRAGEAELKARLEQAQRHNEQLRQENAALAEHHRALCEEKGRLEGQTHTLGEELQRLRSQVETKTEEIRALRQEYESLRAGQARWQRARRREKSRWVQALTQWQSAFEECLTLRQLNTELTRQLEAVEKSDGKIWERPPTASPPPFFPASERRARILALSNLKGGVGKTTLAANLAAMLAKQRRCPQGQSEEKCRVLLVDLDYQGSLTSLCLTGAEIQRVRDQKRFMDGLLCQAAQHGCATVCLQHYSSQHTEVPGLWIIPADENLADIENQVMARWLVKPAGGDVRFLLRELLHAPEVAGAFDFVILDCPPRLTTACVNAYAAADYVIVPVIPDPTSTEAVPRQLRTLCNHRRHLCPDLAVLGLVANRTNPRRQLIQRERQTWEALRDPCRDVWGQEVYQFRTFIRQKAAFHDAARDNRLAVTNSEIEAMFRDLAQEVLQRIAIHEGRRPV